MNLTKETKYLGSAKIPFKFGEVEVEGTLLIEAIDLRNQSWKGTIKETKQEIFKGKEYAINLFDLKDLKIEF